METLRLLNVRSFGDSGKIRISPLTLLLGQNSSGKSTFARFFPLLRQTAEVLAREPILWYGRLVDFGTVEEVTSKFSPDQAVGADFSFQIDRWALTRRRRGIGLQYRAAPATEKIEVRVSVRYLRGGIYEFRLGFLDFEFSLQIKDSIVIQILINGTDYSQSYQLSAATWSACFPNLTLKETQASFVAESSPFVRQLSQFVRQNTHGKSQTERVQNITRSILYSPLDNLLEALKHPTYADSIWQRNTSSWSYSTFNFKYVRDLILGARMTEIIEAASTNFRATCSRIRYITPLRASAERYYRQQGLALGEIDPQGRNVAMFLHNLSSSERQRFSEWMSSSFGFYVDTEASQGHISMVIREGTKDELSPSFNLADTGFGFSQMIPILIQIWATTGAKIPGVSIPAGGTQIISVEQPELHLHPRLQAKLADVLLKAIAAARQNSVDLRVIVETHSEQIVNRVGRRIAEGIFPRDGVSVALFDKKTLASQTEVTQTHYDEEGVLDQWPYGFFESLDE